MLFLQPQFTWARAEIVPAYLEIQDFGREIYARVINNPEKTNFPFIENKK
jgi:hypothetical protein